MKKVELHLVLLFSCRTVIPEDTHLGNTAVDVDVTKSFSSLLSFSIFLKLISNIHQSITY